MSMVAINRIESIQRKMHDECIHDMLAIVNIWKIKMAEVETNWKNK